jgi:hypothetical protein
VCQALPDVVEVTRCDPIEVSQRKLAVTGFELPVLAGGDGLGLYPPKLGRKLSFESAAAMQSVGGSFQLSGGGEAAPAEDTQPRCLLEGVAAGSGPPGDDGVDGPLTKNAVATEARFARDRSYIRKSCPRAIDPVLGLAPA